MKRLVVNLALSGLALAAMVLLISSRQTARRVAEQTVSRNANAPSAAESEQDRNSAPPTVPVMVPAPAETAAPVRTSPEGRVSSGPSAAVRAAAASPTAKTNTPAKTKAKPPLQDPLARAALSFVGTDAAAEEYWAAAINDPTLPAHERQDLIEDLNEEGFPDPKHVTADDLPLIVSRIALIEDYALDAMDDVNAAAFLEAYKDLLNMFARVTQP